MRPVLPEERPPERTPHHEFVAHDRRMLAVAAQLLGESGTGKELLAQRLPRSQ